MAFVIFKKPGIEDITFWEGTISNKPEIIEDDSIKKFIISPYQSKNKCYSLIPEIELFNKDIKVEHLALKFKNEIPQNLIENEYCNLVKKAVETFETNKELNKVVLTRANTTNTIINPFDSFFNLCKIYPNAFVHLISSEITGTWIGASPELLLKKEGNIINTVALAGTIHKSKENQNWTLKETIEQNWVEIYIENILKELKLDFNKIGPNTLEIGNLKHLLTNYNFKNNRQIKIEEFLEKLNPTPAVCGIPQKLAKEFIDINEAYDRSLYTGFIGPYYDDTNFQFYVNLRCMQIHLDKITQYAGAGITIDSEPGKEWIETENKMKMTRNHLAIKL